MIQRHAAQLARGPIRGKRAATKTKDPKRTPPAADTVGVSAMLPTGVEDLVGNLLSIPQQAFYLFDHQRRVFIWGESEVAAIYGYTAAEIVAQPEGWASLVHPDDRAAHLTAVSELLESTEDHITAMRMRVLRKDGMWEWVVVNRRPQERSAEGRVVSELGVVQVITNLVASTEALKKSEAALCQSEDRYARAMRGVNDGLWDWDIKTGIDYFSPRWAELLGYSENELIHHESTFSQLLHPDDLTRVWGAVEEHLTHGTVYDVEMRLRAKNGEYRWFRSRGHAEWDAAGAPVRMAGSITEITDRKLAEDALKDSERRYRFLADHADDIVALTDTEGGRLYISPSYFRKTGWTLEQVLSTDWRTRVHPDDLPHVLRTRETNLAGQPTLAEHRTRCSDGSWLWLESQCKPILDAEGKVWRMLTSSHDITERKKAEADFQRESEFNKALVSHTTALILVMEPSGTVIHINAAVERRFGYTLQEVAGCNAWDIGILDVKETERSKKRVARLINGEDNPPAEIRMKTKAGEWLLVEIGSTATREKDGTIDRIIVTGTDVTERDRLQQEVLRISEREQARIGHDLHDGVGQTLTGVVSLLEALEWKLQGEAKSDAARISQLARDAIQEVRRLSHGLSPAAVKNRGLAGALQLLSETVRTNFRRPCEFIREEELPALDDEVETHLFRIAQEAVNNAMRHAHPKTIRLRLSRHGDEGALSIEDDGRGLPKAKGKKGSKGIGLRVMDYRAKIIDGDVQLLPRDGGGVQVVCRFPLPKSGRQKRKKACARDC